MHLTRSIDLCQYNVVLPVHVQFQTGWTTFIAMKDTFDQCLYRPQVEVAREVLRARDLLIDLEKVALHPVFNEDWKIVSNLNIGIVEALKLKQPVLVALFIVRRLGEATASEKAGAIRSAHAQRKELKAIRVKGGFTELANRVIPPPTPRFGLGSATRVSPPPTMPAAVSKVVFFQRHRRLRQRIHGKGLRWRRRARQRRAGALRPHERVVPPGTRGVGWPRRSRGRQRSRPRDFPEAYPRGFDFHKPPPYDLAIERMFQVRQLGPCPPVLPQLRSHTRKGQLSVGVTPAVGPSVGIYVRRPDTRLLHRPRAQAR